MKIAATFLMISLVLCAARGEDIRFTDDINGFSLIPPVGAIQTKVDEAAVLAQWIKVDAKTSNLEWAFSVSRLVADVKDSATGKKLSPAKYASLKMSSFTESILAEVKEQPDLKILSQQEAKIAGHPAMVVECSGLASASLAKVMNEKSQENQRWMKQAWVRVTPRMFLTFKIVAREKFKRRAQIVWQGVMDTLKITDDKAGSVRQQEKVIAAEKLLDALSKEKLQGAFTKETEWFIISQNGVNVGWLCMGTKPGIFLEAKGYELRSFAMIRIAGQPVKLVYQQMFVSEDLKIEQWRLWMQAGDGDQAQLMAEDGLIQSNRILCETNSSTQGANKQVMDLPLIAANMYLPKALGTVIAAQLADSGYGGYIFAEYDSGRNNLSMREITVVGPEELATDNGLVKAVKIIETTDRANKPTTYWISPTKQILKIQNPAGMVMTAAGRDIVLKYFPNATTMINAIRKSSQKKWKEGTR